MLATSDAPIVGAGKGGITMGKALLSTVAAAAAVMIASCTAALAGDAMTGAELTALLANGKTIQLGGPGAGYAGELALNADGTGKGTAKADDGTNLTITGTWKIKGDQFCRAWKEFDDGKDVCETWEKDSGNKVLVMVDGKKIGVNHW
jgi:hypothetical protein